MSSNRDNTTRPESSSPSDRSPRRSPRDEQQSGSVSSWFSRTFIPSPPAGPRLRPSGSHTTRQRQQNLEQALRGQISLPTPLPRARQSPSSLPNRDGSPSTSIGSQREDLSFPTEAFVAPRPAPSPPSKNMVPNPTETFLAPRPAPSPLSRNLASSPPQRSRLPTYGGRPVQGPGSSGLASPSQVTPAVSPRQGTCIPPAAEVQVPPSRGSQKSGAARDKVPIRNVATPPVVVQPESITSTSSSSEQPIQQNRASCSLSPPRPTGFGTSPRSKIPTRASTPMRKREVEDIPASLVSYSSDSPPTIEKVTYSSVSDSYTAEISTREIQPLSQKQQQEPLHAAEFLVKSIPESSSMFCTASPVTGSSMSPVDSSPEVPQVDNIVHVPKARDHTSYELPSNLSVLFSGFSRRPSPNIGSSTRSSTPSRGGNTGAPDFASETPEQRGARHAANQSVYDRMSPVLRQARSGFEAVRDWVTENGGRMNKDNDNTQEFPQTEEVVKETPEKVIPTVEGSTFTTDISEFLISNLYDQSLHIESEDAISDSSIKKPTSELESIQAVASGATEISTLTNTSESNASIATSDVATSVSVVRRLRKKTSFFNLRAPEPMPANLRVTDDEFYHEIPTTLLDAITPVVNSFVGMGLLEGCLSDEEEEEEKGVQTEMVLDNTDNFKDKDLSFQAFPSDEQRFSYTQEDFLDDFDADATNLSYRASTHDNTEVPIDIGMSLEPSSPEEEEVETEQHALVQPASTTADIPFRTDADQVSGVHPLIAATYPWNPHFQGAEEEFGGPVTIIPPPTTADGYLNIQAYWSDGRPIPIVRHGDIDVENCYKVTEEEKVKVEGGEQKGQERSETLVSAPQSLKNAVVEIAPEVPRPGSRSERRSRSKSSLSRSSSQSHSRRHSIARKTRRTKAMHRLNMRPTVLSTILEEGEEEGEAVAVDGRDSKESTRSSPASGIIQCQETMSEWLLSTAILDDRGGIWIPPVIKEREFEALEGLEELRRVRGRGVGVGSGVMEWGEEEEEELERHLLPLRRKKVAAEELERERRALLRRWEDSDISILEIPGEVLRRLWDEEKGGLREVTELGVEEVDLIVRETQRSAAGDAMRRVKMEATTAGSSRWLRMSPLAKRQFVKFNLTDLKDKMALAAAVRGVEDGEGRKRGYRGRRCSETFVVFEARRRRENHENAPPVLGMAVGRPRKEKRSLWTRCGEAVQGFFRAAVALSSQPKPKKEKVKEKVEEKVEGSVEERGYDVVRVGRGLRRVQRGDSSVIALRAPPTQVDEASDLGNQKRHRRKRSVVRGLLSPILPKVGESKVARRD